MPAPITPQEVLDAFQVAPEPVKLAISNIVLARRLDVAEAKLAAEEGVADEVHDEE